MIHGTLPRRGLTLLEVIVSMAIFLIALGAIVPLIQMGQDRALDVQLQAIAMEKCQSKLSEIVTGSESLETQSDMPFPESTEEENWLWSLEANPQTDGINSLWTVKVTVYRELEGGTKVEVSLSQMILDPTVRGAPQPAPSTASGTTSATGG